ncbi:MAG: hypothetical protein GXP33_03585 [Spirochaetes bacterium]|nr:hypothetical protein [Spirochaetota bacterium]
MGEDTWFCENVSSSFLFIAGLFLSVSVILQKNLILKAGQFLFFIALSALIGRKIRYFINLIFLLITVIFNCLAPAGRVLFYLFKYPITEDALKSGLSKGLTIITLIYISKISVRRNIKLPGKLGILLGYAFNYVNELMQSKNKIVIKEAFKSIDKLLLETYKKDNVDLNTNYCRNRILGVIIVSLLVTINVGLLYF